MSFKTKIISFTLVAAVTANVGCAGKSANWKIAKSWDIRHAIGLKSDEPEPPQIPIQMVNSWTNTVLTQPGTKAQRGFGGRIMFFGKEGDSPVRVDGQLVVYAFDESLGDPNTTHPTRRFIFPKEQFVRHESESQLGPSYSVWLPWDVVGGEQKNISLIARFEPLGGALLVGEQTRHLLPGTSLASEKPINGEKQATGVQLAQHTGCQNSVRQAVHENAPPTTEKPKTKMTSSTIPLSNNWHQRLVTGKNSSKVDSESE